MRLKPTLTDCIKKNKITELYNWHHCLLYSSLIYIQQSCKRKSTSKTSGTVVLFHEMKFVVVARLFERQSLEFRSHRRMNPWNSNRPRFCAALSLQLCLFKLLDNHPLKNVPNIPRISEAPRLPPTDLPMLPVTDPARVFPT